MKQLLLILFCTCSSLLLSAQKIHFSDSSNLWVTLLTENDPPNTLTFQYSFNGDTVIHSLRYKIIPYVMSPYASCGSCSSAFIRDDTILKKVFILINDSEKVLMDYNLNIGDSIVHTDPNHDTTIYTVSHIDSSVINSVYHKVWEFALVYPTHFAYASYYYVIEGVGCTNGPLFVQFPSDFESIENLTCFYSNGTHPTVSPAVDECAMPIHFDNQTSCTTGVNVISKTVVDYNIFPNPATTSLTITSPQNITNITITNLIGQTVYTHEYNSPQVHIDVANLPTGIYFVKVNNTEVRKFVKE